MAKEYDLVIIGSGPGGYVSAIRASQLGLKTAIVEKNKLGGTCLHSGCIPTKTLLKSAEVYRTIKESDQYGIASQVIGIDFSKIQNRKNDVIDNLHQGIQFLMKKEKVDVYHGTGRILGPSIFSPMPGTVSVELEDKSDNEMLIPKNVLIATGSRPKKLEGIEFDGEIILSSDDCLNMERLPNSMLIIGGGVIGVEWASMLADLDVDVTIVEYAERLIPSEDEEISKELANSLKKKGVQVLTNAKVLAETLKKSNRVKIQVEIGHERKELEADKVLLSVGRIANTNDLGLENTDIELHDGKIRVNDFYQTKESHIYAIGDCIGGIQLAHVASREGIIAVEHMAGLNPTTLNERQVPKCIYSSPEVASIGLTEQKAKDLGYSIKVGKFPFKAIGKALVNGKTDGFVKMIADKKTDDLLGVHLIGSNVTELISEASLATLLDATPWEIAEAIHPHPTLSEIFAEVSMAVDGKAIHG
ncbi:dihydrolipoyl dehydrogenase [Pallidibacillus thermolactis]|jgi:dihydrolipoamide dehydrogenase|uniref:dihydrolipoyl dehydrogenase n=1 Tax=Pallidibacillus thermolactis TaxID=251051 RepID=UPI00156BABD9|nr:dihydrolipoyl dehydrogenase [Pallidibacillus thermolactis]MCU9600302.1 dihydrolipoyl dehydrogenase [Pallidibacillus thermolactis subsp. kokeshiiformis]